MSALRPLGWLIGLAAVGFVGAIAAGAAVGMGGSDLAHLAALILPALAVTVLATAIAWAGFSRTSIRVSTAAVAVVGAVVGLANMVALSSLMIVSGHDATLMAVLLVYAAAAGIGAALALGRARARAIDRLTRSARELGAGNLSTRIGPLGAGTELDTLARTLDEMAERLQDAMVREREVEATRRDLMTAISHDLRTPLASLRAMVEAVDDGVVHDGATLHRYSSEMRRSVMQLVTMVDDLFELAQLDARDIHAEAQRAKLAEVVGLAMDAVELQAQAKELVLRTDLGAERDTPCSPRLARVLQNLVANAVQYTPADGTVLIEATRRDGELEVAVEDTGEGIAPQDLPRIFEPFYRADPARSGPGAGLGLTLSKRIVESLGGCLDVRSAHTGTRFSVRVPLPS
jgi:two-component system, OmpR family, sensor histidine kinase SaeS